MINYFSNKRSNVMKREIKRRDDKCQQTFVYFIKSEDPILQERIKNMTVIIFRVVRIQLSFTNKLVIYNILP